MANIIGLCGPAGVGKTAIATELLRTHAWVRRESFANNVRSAANIIFGLTEREMTDAVLKEEVLDEWGLTPRQMLQRLGTEVAREVHHDVWVRGLARRLEIQLAVNPLQTFIIDDVRFRNEVDWIHSQGGVLLEIRRKGVEYANDHASSQSLEHLVDATVVNVTGLLDNVADEVWGFRHGK